jgi:PRTRC genetic system protein A
MTFLSLPALVGHLPATVPLRPFQQGRAYEYLYAENGIFLRAETAWLSVQLCLHAWQPGTVRGLPPLASYVRLHHRPIPAALLQRVMIDAQQRRNAQGQLTEWLYRVARRDDAVVFELSVPLQDAGVASVTAAMDTENPLLELHSHGSLAAFWSSTDDRDEGGFQFYGVIGRLDTEQPEIRLRLGVYGYWWEIPLTVLFEAEDNAPWQDLNAAETLPIARWLTPDVEAL